VAMKNSMFWNITQNSNYSKSQPIFRRNIWNYSKNNLSEEVHFVIYKRIAFYT
jgi:hypothetical protein